ncbi:MAG: flagellar basal body rod protein FlgB [FCB group bacterium]|nr:flagellar basal body rod protein FlgB [FCB group bacterium]
MANTINDIFWNKTGINKFGKMLDITGHRHKLISGNIANATTPGYAAKDIDFKSEMQKALGSGQQLAMKTTSGKHLGNTGPQSEIQVIEHGPESDDDLNGVDIDTEITNMAVNQMRYSIGARMLQKKMSFFKKVITGR